MPSNGSGGYVPPSNSFNPATNGVAATAVDWNATLTDIAAAIQQSVSADGQTPITGNLAMGGNKLTGLAAGSGTGQSLRYEQLFSQGTLTDIASAATVDIGAQLTNFLRVTGTTTITSFGTNYNGPRFITFADAVVLTHSTTLVLPSAANITTAANDALIAIPISGGWQVVEYLRASGDVDAKSINKGQISGFRNRVHNGNFNVNQRVVSGTVTLLSGQYGHDRWKAGASGCTYTFSTTNNVTTLTITAGSLLQIIEGVNLESGTYTLSWGGTAQGKIAAGSYSASGVTASVTGGMNTTIEFNAGTLSKVQFEFGFVSTVFEQRPQSVELQLCQRYLPSWTASAAYLAQGQCYSTTQALITLPTKIDTRTALTGVSIISGTLQILTANGAQQALTSLTFSTGSVSTLSLTALASSASLVAGNMTTLVCTAGTAVILGTGAEL